MAPICRCRSGVSSVLRYVEGRRAAPVCHNAWRKAGPSPDTQACLRVTRRCVQEERAWKGLHGGCSVEAKLVTLGHPQGSWAGREAARGSYLLVRVVIGVDVIVELLVLLVLLVTELTVEIGPQVLQGFSDRLLLFRIVLQNSFKIGMEWSPI